MALLLVRDEIERSDLPRRADLVQTILDGEFFRRCVRDVLDLVRVLVEAPVDDAFQGEVLRLVVELATSFCLKDHRHNQWRNIGLKSGGASEISDLVYL